MIVVAVAVAFARSSMLDYLDWAQIDDEKYAAVESVHCSVQLEFDLSPLQCQYYYIASSSSSSSQLSTEWIERDHSLAWMVTLVGHCYSGRIHLPQRTMLLLLSMMRCSWDCW